MSLAADALQPFLVRQLASVAGRMELMTIADTITAPSAGFDLTFDEDTEVIKIDYKEPNPLTLALAADCSRFSVAALQSMLRIGDDLLERDNAGWSIVKLYYSAFYAAHGIVRLLGESCSYFDRSHINQLIRVGEAIGRKPTFGMERGVYHCILSDDATQLNCKKAGGGGGGAHEVFWGIFGNKIQLLGEGVLTGSLIARDAQAVFSQLCLLSDAIRRGANNSWLSVIRNELQYRHQHKVWFPEQISLTDRRALSRIAAGWSGDPMQVDLDRRRVGDLGQFVSCCTFLVALLHTMLRRLQERSSAGEQSFVRRGPIAFLNDIRPRTARR